MFEIWLIAGMLALACILAYRRGLFDGLMLRVGIVLIAWIAAGASAFAGAETVMTAFYSTAEGLRHLSPDPCQPNHLIWHAADTVAQTTVNGSLLFAIAQPWLEIVAPILGSVLVALSVYVAAYVRAKWGIDLSRFDLEQDAAHRTALNTVLTNAAGGVIQRLGSASAALNINVGNPIVAEFAKRALAAAPAAAAHFGYTPADLEQKVLNKIPQLLPVEPVSAAPVVPAKQVTV